MSSNNSYTVDSIVETLADCSLNYLPDCRPEFHSAFFIALKSSRHSCLFSNSALSSWIEFLQPFAKPSGSPISCVAIRVWRRRFAAILHSQCRHLPLKENSEKLCLEVGVSSVPLFGLHSSNAVTTAPKWSTYLLLGAV